jgi:hypothetical protein
VIYSIIESCRRHGVEPYIYLRDVLTRLPSIGDLELTMELNHVPLNVENRESLGLMQQSHLQPCPTQNDPH